MSLPGYSRARSASICRGKGVAVAVGIDVGVEVSVRGWVGSGVDVDAGTDVGVEADVAEFVPQAVKKIDEITNTDQKDNIFFIAWSSRANKAFSAF